MGSLALLVALAAVSSAQSTVRRKRDASFKLTGVSVWKGGQGIDQSIKVGPQWSKSDSVGFSYEMRTPEINLGFTVVPSFSLGKTGATLGYDIAAGFGFNMGVKYLNGTADVTADGDVQFAFDRDPQPGKTCTVLVSYVPRSTSKLLTTSPQLSASLESTMGFDASVTASLDFLGKSLIGENTKIIEYKQPNLGFTGHYLIDAGKLEDLNNQEAIRLINSQTPVGVTFQSPDGSTVGGLVPGLRTMTSDGFSPFVTVDTTLAQLILAFVSGGAAEKLAFFLDGSASVDPTGKITDLKASWDFAKVQGRFGLGLRHQYTFDPNPHVSVTITPVEPGQTLGGRSSVAIPDVALGSSFTFTMPQKGGVVLKGSFSPAPTLENKVSSAANGGLNITPIELALTGTLGFGDFSKRIDWDFNPWSYDWTSKAESLFGVDDRTAVYTVVPQAYDDVQINPSVPDMPTPSVYGDLNGEVQYLTAPAYGGWAYGAGEPKPHRLSIYSQANFGFCGLASGWKSITFAAETWDGKNADDRGALVPPGGSGEATFRLADGAKSRTTLPIDVNPSLLRPGTHSLRFKTSGAFAPGTISSRYDVPVIVPLPDIHIDGALMTGTHDSDHPVNYLDAGYKGEAIYCQVDNALLETEVALDDGSIVLPTTRYLGGQKITTGGGDETHPVYTDAQEYNWFTSGNNVISFTVPPALARRLAGTRHAVRLRTKDPFGDGYVLSEPADTPIERCANPLYFYAPAPTFTGIAYNGATAIFPILNDAYPLTLTGKGFTPSTKATLKTFGKSYAMSVEYVDPHTLKATVPKAALDDQQASPASATIQIETKSYVVDPAYGFGADSMNSFTSGGTASQGLAFRMPAPVVTGVDPGTPVRGAAAELTVYGSYFSKGATASATSEVSFGGAVLPAGQVTFPSNGRGFTTMKVRLTAAQLAQAGPNVLRVRNGFNESKFNVTVSNAKPKVNNAGFAVRLGDGSSPQVTMSGGMFYPETQAFVNGKSAAVVAQAATTISVKIDAGLKVPSTTMSVLNPAPGGGQSAEIPIQILEGDATTLTLKRGIANFNSQSGIYEQPFALAYRGGRTMKGEVGVTFTLPEGVTLEESNGTLDGLPCRRLQVNLLRGDKTTFIIRLKTTAKTQPAFTTGLKIVN